MKSILTLLTLLIFGYIQAQEMAPGTGFFTVGIGPSTSYVSYHTSVSPAIRLTYDKGFKEIGPGTLTLGGVVGGFTRSYDERFYSLKYNTNYTAKWRWTYLIAAFRLGYYYNFKELDINELNAYAGFSVGPRFSFFSDSYDGPADAEYYPYSNSAIYLHVAGFLGVNYFITPKTAIFTEFGYDISYFTLGLTFKM